jgi:hypothetical protein
MEGKKEKKLKNEKDSTYYCWFQKQKKLKGCEWSLEVGSGPQLKASKQTGISALQM